MVVGVHETDVKILAEFHERKNEGKVFKVIKQILKNLTKLSVLIEVSENVW